MQKPVICIGAALVDELLHATETILLRTTTPVVPTKTSGGVSRNIAHQMALLGLPVQLVSAFGCDADGEWLKHSCREVGIQLDGVVDFDAPTGKYTGVLAPDGSLFAAFLGNSLTELISAHHLEARRDLLSTAAFLLLDTNLSMEAMDWLLNFSRSSSIPLVIEPVSVAPARKLKGLDLRGLYLITPNEDELPALLETPADGTEAQVDALLAAGVQNIWLHQGAEGSTFVNAKEHLKLGAPRIEVVDCTGAGDSSVAAFLMAKYRGLDNLSGLKRAHSLAADVIQVKGAVVEGMNAERLERNVVKYFPL
jgi:pseudouridine kinase